jgi:hypothetical protein
VQRPHRELGVLGRDHARDLDLRGGDAVDVDALLAEDLEHPRGHPEWFRIPTPTMEILAI